jgi:endo-1,4-beta-xylanase
MMLTLCACETSTIVDHPGSGSETYDSSTTGTDSTPIGTDSAPIGTDSAPVGTDSTTTDSTVDSETIPNNTDSEPGTDTVSTDPVDTGVPPDSATSSEGQSDSDTSDNSSDSSLGTDGTGSDSSDSDEPTDSATAEGSDDSETGEAGTDTLVGTDDTGSDSVDTVDTFDSATTEETDDSETGQNNETSLYKKYQNYFPIGAAIDSSSYRDAHASILKEHFNSVVCENEMKWTALQASEGNFNYSQADQMVQFAKDNGMLVRGHVLVWHDQTPDWVFSGASKATLLQRIRTHVTTVMNHFKGKVYAWDVVNEAVTGNKADGSDAGEDLSQVVSWGYRNSQWYQIAGEDYILEAFRAARAADPGAKLFYNDYWNYLDDKRAFIITIIQKLQAENLIDGVGLQCHLNISPAQEVMTNQTVYQTVENLEKEIQEYAALGLEVQITEMDISIYTRDYSSSDQSKWYNDYLLNDDYQNRLAARYKEFFDMFRQNRDKITNVTLWGIADDNTWLSEFPSGRPDQPLLFDKNLQPKKAFDAVMDF